LPTAADLIFLVNKPLRGRYFKAQNIFSFKFKDYS